MKKFVLLLLVVSIFSFCYFSYAQDAIVPQAETPEALKEQAYAKISTATSLLQKAEQIIKTEASTNKESLRAAIALYAEAGKQFEQALNVFLALGSEYATQQDVDGCTKAIQDCMNAINMCKKKYEGAI